ncbi:MAG: sugar phosphate isomerase/epimerase [Candidatus Bathyarchaeota archaeon]|nr:MAG: sugar phosphate isomerase/epimerase [Candidatus Bathyarchaeota archaeon]
MDFPNERFGYHVVYDRDIYDAIDFASEHGFGYIVPDLMIPRFWPESIEPSERGRIRRHAEDRGVSISFHGPSDRLNLAAPYPEVRQGILQRMKCCLKLARALEAERFTIHPSQPLNFASNGKPGTYLKDHWGLYVNALSEGIRGVIAEAEGVQVCVENEPLTPFVEEVLEGLMEEEDLFLTLDVPKVSNQSKGAPIERVEAFYHRNIDRVREVHLHDRRPGGTYHDILGQGEVDVEKCLRMFAPHDVHFTLEIRPRENAHRSLQYIREIWEEIF